MVSLGSDVPCCTPTHNSTVSQHCSHPLRPPTLVFTTRRWSRDLEPKRDGDALPGEQALAPTATGFLCVSWSSRNFGLSIEQLSTVPYPALTAVQSAHVRRFLAELGLPAGDFLVRESVDSAATVGAPLAPQPSRLMTADEMMAVTRDATEGTGYFVTIRLLGLEPPQQANKVYITVRSADREGRGRIAMHLGRSGEKPLDLVWPLSNAILGLVHGSLVAAANDNERDAWTRLKMCASWPPLRLHDPTTWAPYYKRHGDRFLDRIAQEFDLPRVGPFAHCIGIPRRQSFHNYTCKVVLCNLFSW